jgi:hypothetical protein
MKVRGVQVTLLEGMVDWYREGDALQFYEPTESRGYSVCWTSHTYGMSGIKRCTHWGLCPAPEGSVELIERTVEYLADLSLADGDAIKTMFNRAADWTVFLDVAEARGLMFDDWTHMASQFSAYFQEELNACPTY